MSDTKIISYDSYSSIASGVVNLENGKGKFDFNVKSPEWGRYLVVVTDMDGGHSAGKVVYIDWPGWAGRSQESGSGSAFMLPLVSNKKQYSSGETEEISFGSSKGQRALVTIEKAGKILKQDWLETKDGTTVYKLPLTDNMAPNIYAHITLLQEHMQTANSLPIRLYGVIPLEVENPQTRLEPVITMADRFEPNKECTVSVSEKNGRGMTYTIAIVDEGLLGLTNHHVPDVWSQFYKKEASRLSSWDLYTYVMNAYSGKLETILAVGGGEDSTDSRDRESNRFKPVVKYFGPFTIQPGEKKATKFMMPSYIGAVRAMVVAADNGSYGTAEKTALVKTDIMVQSALPRTLGAGETINVPVTVFNLTDKSQDFNVRLAASGALNLNLEQSVNIRTNDNATVFFKVPAEKTGTAKFNIKTSSGQLTSEENIEVPVLSRGTPVTYRENYIIAAGKSKTVSLNAKNLESIIVKNEISTIPEINLERWLDYLVKYPHGCIEQITSGGFPQMYLPAFIKLSPEKIEKIKENVNSVIRRYTDYQSASGGFAYWPGNSVPDKWGSCYGAHFLLEAKKNGYTVPDNLFDPLMKFIQEQASAWRIEDDESNNETQAYALFVLAMAKKQNLTAMNRMQDYIDASSISSTARLLLSASYALAGDSKTAVKIMRGIGISELFFRSTGGSFSSSFREKAMHLYAGTVTGELASNAKLASEIAEFLKNENWLSTQDVAWALMALMPYYINQASSPAGYELEYDGKSMAGIIEKRISVDDLGEKAHGGMEKLTVKNTAKQALYGLFYVSGMAEPGTEMLQNDRIKLTVSYKDDNGRKIAPEALKNGDNFKIIIEVSKLDSNKKYENLALTFPVPTAWEINNERLGKESGDSSSSYDYQDIRDSYIYTYFNLASNKTATFSFDATVCYSGKYYIPAVHAEAMYDNTISAVVPGKLISE